MTILSDLLSLRKKRLSLQREADLLEQEEKKLTNDLIAKMLNEKLEKVVDGEDEVTIGSSLEPVVDSWPQLLDYIISSGSVDLLQKRMTPSAIKARWLATEEVPGVSSAVKHTLKFNI